jgi:hypothetical protein
MADRLGIGGHQSPHMEKDEWLTPPWVVSTLGPFDLDPCAPIIRPWDTASVRFTKEDDGLSHDWFGFVWMNPPYGAEVDAWLKRLSDYGNGIALIFARTETNAFHRYVWESASALFFFKGRLTFYHSSGASGTNNGGAPSVLIAYGQEAKRRLKAFPSPGYYLEIR